MKSYIFFLLSMVLYVIGCQKNIVEDRVTRQLSDSLLCQYGSNIRFKSPIDSLLLEFVNQNNLKKVYGQIYINKIYEDSTIITIISRQFYRHENPILSHNFAKPLFYIKIKDCIFDIYSGAEEEIVSNYNYPKQVKDTSEFIVWQLHDIDGHIKKSKKDGLPFMEDPLTELPPEIKLQLKREKHMK